MTRKSLTDRKRIDMLLALASGLSKHAAAAKAGISYRQFARWQTEDEAYAEAVDAAIDQARVSAEERVLAATDKDWRAAAWWLDYLDGIRRGKTEAHATVVVQAGALPPMTEQQIEAAAVIAKEAAWVLIEVVGREKAAEVIQENLLRDPRDD